MRSHLRTLLTAAASATIAFAATGYTGAATSDDEPVRAARVATFTGWSEQSADPTPTVSSIGTASASPSASAEVTTAPAEISAMPRTNLTAVFNPVAVPVTDGYRVTVGVRNSGPRSIIAPADQPATTFRLEISWTGPSTSLGGCEYAPERPPIGGPGSMAFYTCRSGRTLRVGDTYWQSFVFPNTHFFTGLRIVASGYADDPNPGDNWRDVEVRVAGPGSLPVTGAQPIGFVGCGLVLIIVGCVAIWYGRRKARLMSSRRMPVTTGKPE